MMKALFFLFLFSVFLSATATYRCSHDEIDVSRKIDRVHLIDSRKATKNVGGDGGFNQEFRLFLHYNFAILGGSLSTAAQDKVKNTMTRLQNDLKLLLSVRRTPSPIRLRRQCVGNQDFLETGPSEPCFNQCSNATVICGFIEVLPSHLQGCTECNGNRNNCIETISDGAGVPDADYILYVTGTHLACGDGTLAFAAACQLEDQYDRPIAGIANFCPSQVTANTDDEELYAIAKHEVFHALGFSDNLYAWFRDENGNARTRRNATGSPPINSNGYVAGESTVRTVTYTDWKTRNGPVDKTVTQIVTPKVVDVGRRHFNCSTLEGVQLEDEGSEGTAGSHWEKRLLENEAMTGFISYNPVFSNFSYAILEDSGWYKVNYSKADILVWGHGDGCGYTAGSCGGYIQSKQQQNQPITPFCNVLQNVSTFPNLTCKIDRTAVAHCDLYQHNQLVPEEYQYFNSGANFDSSYPLAYLGGIISGTDYCPFYVDLVFHEPRGKCRNGIPLTNENLLAETYGSGSRCVEHSGPWQIVNGTNAYTNALGAGCYEYQCSKGVVTIFILGQPYTCSRAGQVIQVNQTTNGVRYSGGIVCPSCVEICYDDFENCPEAGQKYGEFATPPTTTDSTPPTSTPPTSTPPTSTPPTSTPPITTDSTPPTTTNSTPPTTTDNTPPTTTDSTPPTTTDSTPPTTTDSTPPTTTDSTPSTTTDSVGNLLPMIGLLIVAIFASSAANF